MTARLLKVFLLLKQQKVLLFRKKR